MKIRIAITILAGAALACAQQKTDAKSAPAKTADSASAVPAGAERVDAYTYRYTDAKGKIWIYHQTPFGYSKYEDPATAKAPTAASQSGVKLPADAQRIDDSTYRYRDAQGKTWIYAQTPFGFSRSEESATPKPVQASDSNPVKVRDLGDSYEFVKTSPFGQSRWTRKKTDLSADERDMVNQNQTDPTTKQETR
jgi:hypothetical protein